MPEAPLSFVYRDGFPARVRFGCGARRHLGEELRALKIERALVITTAGRTVTAIKMLENCDGRVIEVFAGAVIHTPHHSIAGALDAVDRVRADGLIAFGGGSALGLSKALARRRNLPQVAVPTTYAGSEASDGQGETVDGEKKLFRDPNMLPRTIVYDPELSLSLPGAVSVNSGFNAMAHAVGALYAPADPTIGLFASEGLRIMRRSLPLISANGQDVVARTDALYGAWLCGMSLRSITSTLHHRICHALGSISGLPHSDVHAVMLPYVIAHNGHVPNAVANLASALESERPARALQALARDLGGARSLAALGMSRADIGRVAGSVDIAAAANPVPVTRRQVHDLIEAAHSGVDV